MRSLYLLIALLFFSGCGPVKKKQVTVAVAANMQLAMDSIAILFEEEHSIKCKITAASSGVLTAQIEKGAPYDVFMSANMAYPLKLEESGFGSAPKVYAHGRLILVYSKELNFKTISDVLASTEIDKVALADPKTAPYGKAAKQYMINTGQLKEYDSKLIYGESIGQVNQYLTLNAVKAAFTSYSFIVKNAHKFNFIEVEQKYFDEILQGVSLLKKGEKDNAESSAQFIDFLKSDKCRKVLEYFGYFVP